MAEPRRRRPGAATRAPTAPEGGAGVVRLRHEDATGCSHAGIAYPADRHGDVLVPAAAAGELQAHGFAPAPMRAEGS